MIDVQDLVKVYRGGVKALDGVTFSVRQGELFGFLGPNGAGKSTTIKVLVTLTAPTAGRAGVAGIDAVQRPAEVRRRIGYAAQEAGLDKHATGRENLLLQGRLYHMPERELRARVDELLALFDLTEAANRLVGTYSGGMRKRLDLAAALVHRPAVLFLDEPTVGLDPQSRAHVWEYIRRLKADGMTVLLTTHYLEEADQLADRIAIIDRGRIVAQGTPASLKDAIQGDRVSLRLSSDAAPEQAVAVLQTLQTGEMQVTDGVVHVRVQRGAEALPELLRALDAAGVRVAAAEVARPSLDDVFLRHTGRSLRDAG